MAKWNSDDNLRYRRNAFGGAPYGEPFYVDDDMNIVTGFNDKVREDQYNYQLYGDDFVPTASHEETMAHFDNWKNSTGRSEQAFLNNINNPEGYNIWKKKTDSERSFFPSGFLGLWNKLGAFNEPTYEDHANLYYSPIGNKGRAIQEYVQSQPQGPLATVNEDYMSENQRFRTESFSDKIRGWMDRYREYQKDYYKRNPPSGRFPGDGWY